ncbi:hypothetical protein [Leucobacter japonicus]|uniref:hypothetical protein n=1 Tax=Leucobacter japonicus TaxID=1461259 RepID=UPI0006A79F40|nr:hypothetical protein [Leucobacter japonicus]
MIRTKRAAPRSLAGALAAALVAAGAVLGLAAPATAVGASLTPTATVVPNTEVAVAVTGAGYADAPIYPGQQSRNVYVGFVEAGSFDADQTTTPAASLTVSPEGTISGSLTVAATALDRAKSYEVIAWPTRSFPTAENLMARAAVDIDWSALFPGDGEGGESPLPAPTLTVSPNTDVDPAGATLTVEGHNYRPSETGSGFALRFGWIAETWKPTDGATNSARPSVVFTTVSSKPDNDANVQWSENADGTVDFTWNVEVSQAVADAKRPGDAYQLGVFTFGNLATQGLQPDNELFVPVTWKVASEPQPEPVKDPKITVTPSTDLDPAAAHTLTVSATGYTGDSAVNGAYVLFGEQSVWSGVGALPSEGWVQMAWVPARSITNGAFTTQLEVPAGSLDPTKRYHVATSAAHALSITDRSLDAFAEVTVAQPTTPTEPTEPSVVFPVSSTVAQGGTLTFSATGFAPGDAVTAVAHSEPVTIGTEIADADGAVSFAWTVPTGFATGEHTVEFSVNGEVVASAPFTVTAAATTGADGSEGSAGSAGAGSADGAGTAAGTGTATGTGTAAGESESGAGSPAVSTGAGTAGASATATAAAGQLATTGASAPAAALWAGASLLLIGAVAVSLARRRRTEV